MAGKGMVMSIVIGITMLIISVIVAFVIVQEISTVSEDLDTTGQTVRVDNETGAYLNNTVYTVDDGYKEGFTSLTVLEIWNSTNATGNGGYYTTAIETGNATVSGATLTNSSTPWFDNVSISYSYTWTPITSAAVNAEGNFTEAIDNVSSKIPTILLIAAVVLIMAILSMLWVQYQRMGMGQSAGL